MNLSKQVIGKRLKITSITNEEVTTRLSELGMFEGAIIKKLNQAPFSGPTLIQYNEFKLALRFDEASQISTEIYE